MGSESIKPFNMIEASLNREKTAEHDKRLLDAVSTISDIIRSQRGGSFDELIIIDVIQRLGLGWYFKTQIHEALERQFANYCVSYEDVGVDCLHEFALRFRLLRQEGYNASPDIIKKFKNDEGKNKELCKDNDEGKFNKELCKDLRGLLSLLEATQLSIQGEDILDEATEFCKQFLTTSLMDIIEQPMAKMIENALKNPLHKSLTTRFLAKSFFSIEVIYDFVEKKDWMDEVISLAYIDFEMAQTLLKKEVLQVSSWGEELTEAKNLKFARLKPIQWYMWSLGLIPWPNMAEERIVLAKAVSLVYLIDDIFDVHGTFEELLLFTETINRWELGDIEVLPDYMKVCLKVLFDFTNDFSLDIYKKHGCNPKQSLVKGWIDLCNSYMVEAKWFSSGQMPAAEEYLKNGIVSIGIHPVSIYAFFLFGRINQESIEEMNSMPPIVSYAAMIARLWNDIDNEDASAGKDWSYIYCYMNENKEKCSIESATLHTTGRISDAWKSLNQECLSSTQPFSWKFEAFCLNFARISSIFYNRDALAHRQSLEKQVRSLLDGSPNNEIMA